MSLEFRLGASMSKLNHHIFGIFSEGKKTPNVTTAGALKMIFVRQTSPQFTELFCVFQPLGPKPQKLTIPPNPVEKPEIPHFQVHSFCRVQPFMFRAM